MRYLTLLFLICCATGAMAVDSTPGTCRTEYARWYPSESYTGEPETVLSMDISQQTQNLFQKELKNRADELLRCSATTNENPVGVNRGMERLGVAYLLVAMKRYVDYLGGMPSCTKPKPGNKLLSQADDAELFDAVEVWSKSGCSGKGPECMRQYNSDQPYGPDKK